MRRLAVSLEQIAARENLLLAVAKASRGKQRHPAVSAWLGQLEARLAGLSESILSGQAPQGDHHQFVIHDPKRRVITAACFGDRVLHHAILNLTEKKFEAALVDSSYACRPGKGVHAAVAQVQRNLRRFGWWVQVDVANYFGSIDHAALKTLLARRFKGTDFLALLSRIIDASPTRPAAEPAVANPINGKGLSIGALTSQHFANAYLDGADRWLLNHPDVLAHVRYMDDIVWWCDGREMARAVLQHLREYLQDRWLLTLKPEARIGRSERGVRYCGFRIRAGIVLPSARKLKRFRQGYKQLIGAAKHAQVSAEQAQRGFDVLHATLAHTQSLRFRQVLAARHSAYDLAL